MRNPISVYFAVVVACLLSVSAMSAQAQPIAQVSDSTCTVWNGTECTGPSGQGCTSTTFHLDAAGTVTLCASLECEEKANCPYCLSEAYIGTASGQDSGICTHSLCDSGGTTNCLSNVSLPAGDYILYSCKLDCDGSCERCSNSCVATATVSVFP